jgi:beta-glucanase (GH16 family)
MAGGTAVAGGASGGDEFVLLFRDDFDELDSSRWQLMTHSWDTNLALFSSQSVSVQDGTLQLTLLPAPSGTSDDTGAAKSFLGAEVRSYDTIEYGRVRARIRLAKGSAVVSALVTIYTPWPADDWNELDIEALGADPNRVQFNTMVYTGQPQAQPVTTPVSPTQHPQLVDLGFDGSLDYHEYTIEWTPERARFLVDDRELHSWADRIDLMGLPQNVLLTLWASSSAAWAGPVNDDTAGASASYDWVEVYEYRP